MPKSYKSDKIAKKKELILSAYEKSLCNVTATCKIALISRETFYEYKNKDENFKAELAKISDVQIDFVENELMKGIKDGNPMLIKFFLSTKGRKRGYNEKIEVEQTVKNEIILNLGTGDPPIE